MDTCARTGCQTSWRTIFFVWVWMLATPGTTLAAPTPTPAPTPVWQTELDAARLAQARLLLSPPAAAEEAEKQRGALGEAFRQLATKYPDAAAVQKAAGDGAWSLGQSSEAIRYWQRTELLDPRDAATAALLGEEFLRIGQAPEAYLHFDRAVKAAPDVALHHFNLANVLYLFRRDLVGLPGVSDEPGALILALEHFRRAAELSPTDLHLAQAYAETFYIFPKPDWPQALTAWQKVLSLSGGKTDFPNSHLARVSLRMGQPAVAEAYLAGMHDPAFDALKQQLRQQATRLRAKPSR